MKSKNVKSVGHEFHFDADSNLPMKTWEVGHLLNGPFNAEMFTKPLPFGFHKLAIDWKLYQNDGTFSVKSARRTTLSSDLDLVQTWTQWK